MQRTFGLRAALILLVLIAILPAFAVVIQASLADQKARLERSAANLRSLVDLSAAHQEQFIEGARQMLTAVAYAPPVHGGDDTACVQYFRDLQDRYPRYANFGMLDTSGHLACRADSSGKPVYAGDRAYFRNAVQTGDFSIGEYVVGRATGLPSLTFGLPVYQRDKVLRGVLFVALDLERSGERLRRMSMSPDATLVVADAQAVVLASAGRHPLDVGSRVPDGFLRDAILSGEPVTVRSGAREHANEPWLYAVQPLGSAREGSIAVAALMSREDVVAPVERRLYLQLAALSVLTLLGALAAWVFGDRVLARPIGVLLRRINALEREELRLDAPASRSPLRELRELDDRFLAMARTMAERAVQRDAALGEVAGQQDLVGSVLDSMGEGVLVYDTRGHLMRFNAAALRIAPGLHELDREKDPLTASSAKYGFLRLDGVTLLPSSERPMVRALRGENVDDMRVVFRGVWTAGEEKVVRLSSRPLRNPDGRIAGCVLVIADVTTTWRAEQALLDSERRYRMLYEANPHPMWVYDRASLRILTVNDVAAAHYGYPREEFLNLTLADLLRPEDVPRMLERVQAASDHYEPKVSRHLRKDGSSMIVETVSHALEFDGCDARVVLVHDITQRVLAQEALQQLNDTLEQRVDERTRELALANRELETFSYTVSHDLRAPLQVIDGFGKALQTRHAAALDTQAQHYLQRIRAGTGQMSQLIDDLLSLARVTRAPISAEPVDLALRAQQIVEQLRALSPQRQVGVHIDASMPATGDARLLTIVLDNLIGNAWKFTGKAHNARIEVGMRTEPHEGGLRSVYFVRDNGAGFDMAYADKLFKAFQRLHAAHEFEGTGIGLATVQRIVTRHGGRVWAESVPGQGTAFLFTLREEKGHEEQPDTAC